MSARGQSDGVLVEHHGPVMFCTGAHGKEVRVGDEPNIAHAQLVESVLGGIEPMEEDMSKLLLMVRIDVKHKGTKGEQNRAGSDIYNARALERC